MRYSQLLLEAIVSQPKNMKKWFTTRIALLDSIIKQNAQDVAIIKANEHEGDYILRYALRDENNRPMLPSPYMVDLDRHYQLTRIKENLESMIKYGISKYSFLDYAVNSLNDIKPLDDETKSVLAMMPNAEKGYIAYGFEPGNPETENDPEYKAARAMQMAYMQISDALKKTETIISQVKPVLLDLQRRQLYQLDPHKYKPEHAEVETLYHASIYASDIVAHGFASEKPIERGGLGNLGDQQEISFTHSIHIAHDIMRAFKELWMIVHGLLTRKQIASWMQAENIDLKHASKFYMRSDEPVDTVAQTIRLYRSYLALSKIRTDPVFIQPERLIPELENIDIKSIGIVACEVRLTDEDEYRHGEAEFRVPASQVVGSCKRVA